MYCQNYYLEGRGRILVEQGKHFLEGILRPQGLPPMAPSIPLLALVQEEEVEV